jgi:hypothetical protein
VIQAAGEMQLGEIAQRVAAQEGLGADAEERAQPAGIARVVGTVQADDRLGLRPGAVEQQAEAVAEHVQEAQQRRVAVVHHALARMFRQVDGQRAVGAQQSEDALHQPRRRVRVEHHAGQGGRGEGQRGFLRQAQWLVLRALGFAQARQVGVARLDAAQGLEQVGAPGCVGQPLPPVVGRAPGLLGRCGAGGVLRGFHRLQATGRAPRPGFQRISSPRVSEASTVST